MLYSEAFEECLLQGHHWTICYWQRLFFDPTDIILCLLSSRYPTCFGSAEFLYQIETCNNLLFSRSTRTWLISARFLEIWLRFFGNSLNMLTAYRISDIVDVANLKKKHETLLLYYHKIMTHMFKSYRESIVLYLTITLKRNLFDYKKKWSFKT